jgi:ABC-2 type transport system ATP-binding protein
MLLEITDLTKKFGHYCALDRVSFAVRAGEIVGLLGPNGAGKSTTVHTVLGFIRPSSGQIRLFGMDPLIHRETVFARLNFTSPYVGFPMRLTVFENLFLYAKLYGISNSHAAIRNLLQRLCIDDLCHKPFWQLSSGEAARVRLCKVFHNEPEFIILDEPLANLDAHAANQIWQFLLDMQRQRSTSILYTSHNMAQAEELCNRVIFLDRGRVVADGTPIEVTKWMLDQDHDRPALGKVLLSLSERGRRETA